MARPTTPSPRGEIRQGASRGSIAEAPRLSTPRPSTPSRWALCLWLLLSGLLTVLSGCRGASPSSSDGGADDAATETLSPVNILQAEPVPGFEQATAPRPFQFPADHGPHPTFRTEWWYFVGNLHSDSGRAFGYQLTFFRQSARPEALHRDSDWASQDLYFAHFALSDVEGERFFAYERFSRGALGLAGAQGQPFHVWIEDWSVERQAPEEATVPPRSDGLGLWPAILQAADGDISLRLELLSSKPPVAVGDRGLSVKSQETGAASHYYSLTRIDSRGSLRIGDRTFDVQGSSWLDREWSTSTLSPDQTGWDWFALQLDDGRDLMFYVIRRKDGSLEPASHGILVQSDGTSRHLSFDEVDLQVLADWQSPSGATYPAAWRLTIVDLDLRLDIEPRLADQELRLSVAYWEGAVRVAGRQGDRPVNGVGYVELVGYGF